MKLPEQFLKRFQEGREREHQAMLHLGIACAEFEAHKQRLLKQALADRRLQSDAVREGLIALGLDPESREHHYHVEADGGVKELIAGEYVEMTETKQGGKNA